MDNNTLKINASKRQFLCWLVSSVLLGILCTWLIFELAIGKPVWQDFLTVLFFSLFSAALTIKQKTEHVIFHNGELIQKNLFRQQSVYLPSLIRAERYVTLGKYPSPRLKLQDELGNQLILAPGDFTIQDLELLVTLLHPYIFVTKVDKNFMDLQFYIEQGIEIPKSSVRQIIRGTFLYILLPCVMLTALLVIWAVLTKQPAFR